MTHSITSLTTSEDPGVMFPSTPRHVATGMTLREDLGDVDDEEEEEEDGRRKRWEEGSVHSYYYL